MPNLRTFRKRPSWEAIGAIAGVAGVLIAILAYWSQVHPGHATSPSADASVSQSPSGAARMTSPTPAPSSHLFKDIVLSQHVAVDVDGASPVVTPGLGGITGNNDVYHDATPVSTSRLYTPDGLYVYKDNPAKAYQECTAYLADTTHTLDPYSTLDIGRSFCFRTSGGHLAFLQMTALDGTPGNYASVTVNVRVWDK